MRRTASLHADEAGFDLREEFKHLRALQLARHGGAAFIHQSMKLKIVLGQIDADSDN